MKLSLVVAAVCLFAVSGAAQTWTPLTHQPSFVASTALLLTDGTVMIHESGGQRWFKLTPDINGSYINGTLSQQASLPSNYSPLYYASAVLPDGRLIVEGGEYNFGNFAWTNLGAIYDPLANTWTPVNPPSGWTSIGDAQSVILPNGTFMLADALSSKQALLDATTLTWTSTGTGKADGNDEEGWELLPDGTLLTVDANANNTNSEKFSPRLGKWVSAGSTIVPLYDVGSHEIGPALVRPDGTVFAMGGTSHTAIYNPQTRIWTQGPDFPKANGQQLDMADAPAALLPNGNVLCDTSPGIFQNGVQMLEFDGTKFNTVPNPTNITSRTSYQGRFLVLPSGQVLFTDDNNNIQIYDPAGNPNPSWAPTILRFFSTLTRGTTSKVGGTQLNGLSAGAAYGDDAQMATNYPIVRITNNSSGHVFYARTHTFSTYSVAPGQRGTAQFDVPANMETGPAQMEVIANGIASTPVAVTVQ